MCISLKLIIHTTMHLRNMKCFARGSMSACIRIRIHWMNFLQHFYQKLIKKYVTISDYAFMFEYSKDFTCFNHWWMSERKEVNWWPTLTYLSSIQHDLQNKFRDLTGRSKYYINSLQFNRIFHFHNSIYTMCQNNIFIDFGRMVINMLTN